MPKTVTCLLQDLLLAYGEYPAKYRLLVWDFLLRLPHHSEAYQVGAAACSSSLNTLGTLVPMLFSAQCL